MKIEYLQRILIDKLDELKCIYSSDFITEMKNDILNEEDIEKLKELALQQMVYTFNILRTTFREKLVHSPYLFLS